MEKGSTDERYSIAIATLDYQREPAAKFMSVEENSLALAAFGFEKEWALVSPSSLAVSSWLYMYGLGIATNLNLSTPDFAGARATLGNGLTFHADYNETLGKVRLAYSPEITLGYGWLFAGARRNIPIAGHKPKEYAEDRRISMVLPNFINEVYLALEVPYGGGSLIPVLFVAIDHVSKLRQYGMAIQYQRR